jgi:hypothetical protein
MVAWTITPGIGCPPDVTAPDWANASGRDTPNTARILNIENPPLFECAGVYVLVECVSATGILENGN